MPALAPAIAGASAFFATPVGGLVLLGGVALVSYLLRDTSSSSSSTDSETSWRGTSFDADTGEDVPVDAIFGTAATAGHYVHYQTYGTDNDYIKLVYVVGSGLHDSLSGLCVDGVAKTLTGSNADPHGKSVVEYNVGGTDYMWVKFYDGSLTQAADAQLVALADPVGRWTTDHKLAGHAYVIVTVRYNETLFGRALPKFLFVVDGLRLYDWRKDPTQVGGDPMGTHTWGSVSTYEFSKNPAVCLFNYRRGIYVGDLLLLGDGAADSDCDIAKFSAAANLSDESVTFPETGRTLPRYIVGAAVSDDMDSQTVTQMFEQAMGGYGAESGGVYWPIPAAQGTPVMTITDADLQKGYARSLQKRMPPDRTYTRVQGVYTEPSQGWQSVPYGTRMDAAVDTDQGGPRTLKLDFGYVPVYETAQMLAEIRRRRDLYTASETCVVRPKFERLETGDLITRETSLFVSAVMSVESYDELDDGSIRLSLREWDNVIVPASGDSFVDVPVEPGPAGPTPSLILCPSAFGAIAVDQVSGTTSMPAVRVSWTAITDPTVTRVVIKYWPDDDGETNASYLPAPPLAGHALITGLQPDKYYRFAATIETQPYRAVTYTSSVLVLTTGLTVASDVPAYITDQLRQLRQLRSLIEQFKVLGTVIEAADRENYVLRQTLSRDIDVKLGEVEAGFNEVIEAAVGPTSAIAIAIQSLFASMGDNTAEVNIKWEAQAAPSGYAARYAIVAQVNDGSFRSATFFIDVPTNPADPTRIGLSAGQTVFFTSSGSPIAMIDENGFFRSANDAVVINMLTGDWSLGA